MKPLCPTLALGLLLLVGCRPESRVGVQVEIVLDSPVNGKDSTGARRDQNRAMDLAIQMLASHAYATEVLHRLSKEDAILFPREEDLQQRLSVTTAAESRQVQIAFNYADAVVAKRVIAAYEDCIVHNAIKAVNPGFHALPAGENAANHSTEPTPSAVR